MTIQNIITNAIDAINDATKSFTGKDWTSGPDEILKMLEKGKLFDADDINGGCYFPNDGTRFAQDMRNEMKSLLRDVANAEDVTSEFVERAQSIVSEEDAYVARRAGLAADEGRCAIECIQREDFDSALDHVEKAAGYEREFGDDPSWSLAVRAVRDLVKATEVDED